MEFARLVEIVGNEPVFESGLLLAGDVDPADVRRQLSRWVRNGRAVQLRRGLYVLAPPFQKVKPHPFVIANHMVRGSYVSCQSALAHYGHIPEYVAAVTSVTAGRPGRWRTKLGDYLFRHMRPDLLSGYKQIQLGGGQQALVAAPEKALLDLIHLQPGGDSPEYLAELRLQELGRLNLDMLWQQAVSSGSARLRRAAQRVKAMATDQREEYETL
jgi:predicted transcriptional regulator of viral defense system